MKWAVTVVSPPGYIHSAAFAEVAETVHYGLVSLGHDSVITSEGALPGRRHIVLGSNLLPRSPLPLAADAILYNLEQVGSGWINAGLITLLRQYVLWDYSWQNAAALQALDIQVACVVPIGYVNELTRIKHASEADIDVLFFGSMNPRRQAVIDRMRATGLHVVTAFGVYGRERDALVGQAKLVLNVHFYESRVLEMVRISYLLANRCAVLSEHSADPAEDTSLAGAVAFAAYEDIAACALDLINAPAERARLACRGFEVMTSRPETAYLNPAIALAAATEAPEFRAPEIRY